MSEVTPTTAETNLAKKTDFANKARVREADFALMFTEGIRKLKEALGIVRLIPKQAGTVLKAYKADGTLVNNGAVGEGETIPLSKYTIEPVTFGELTLKKWRKGTSAEAIMAYGYNQAVSMTTDKMAIDVQKNVRDDLMTALSTGTAVEGKTLQAVLAQTWGKLEVLYEDIDNAVQPVHFVNPMDVADYLSTAQITTQEVFGMTYIKNFLGLGDVFTTNKVTKGKVYSTAKSNIVGYYVPVNGADLGEAFEFTSDELGLVGIHEHANYDNMTALDTVVSGIVFYPEYADGVVVGEIKASAAI